MSTEMTTEDVCKCIQEYDSDTGNNYSMTCDWCLNRPGAWTIEYDTISALMDDIDSSLVVSERLNGIRTLLCYLRTIPEFIRVHTDFRDALVVKISELRVDTRTAPIVNEIAEMSAFLYAHFSDI